MAALQDIVSPDEQIIVFFKRHPIMLLKHFLIYQVVFILLVLVVLFFAMDIYGQGYGESFKMYSFLGAFTGLQCWLHLLFLELIYLQFDLIVVTDRGIIRVERKLMFYSSIEKFELEKINQVNVENIGVLPNLFHYGKLEIVMTRGGHKTVIDYVPYSNEYHRIINNAIRELEREIYHKEDHMPIAKSVEAETSFPGSGVL